MERVSLRMDAETLRLIDHIAEVYGISRSDVIRLSVRRELAKMGLSRKMLGVANIEAPSQLTEMEVSQ